MLVLGTQIILSEEMIPVPFIKPLKASKFQGFTPMRKEKKYTKNTRRKKRLFPISQLLRSQRVSSFQLPESSLLNQRFL
jgi:hypothetical protein